jgi:hypothetical protein
MSASEVNPWIGLCSSNGSYILPEDSSQISEHNKLYGHLPTAVIEGLIPEPFIGNADSAKVILLGLNPGHSDDDAKNHQKPEFREALCKNLCGDYQNYPFYPLNPEFITTTGAGRWWDKRTRELQEECGLKLVAERLMVIEWFPYHSKRFAPKLTCHSQRYSFKLAKDLLGKKPIILRMRARKHWTHAVPALAAVPSLRNPQCGYLSKGNMDGDLFARVVKAITSKE